MMYDIDSLWDQSAITALQSTMLLQNDIMEQLSYAYVHAVAAKAGFRCSVPIPDRDFTDALIEESGKMVEDSVIHSPSLKLQLKSHMRDGVLPDPFSFPISKKTYDALRNEHLMTPHLLVVYIMPKDSVQWLETDEASLTARKCAYWLNLKGLPDSPAETNVTVRIPRGNIFSEEALRRLMISISRQEEIENATS